MGFFKSLKLLYISLNICFYETYYYNNMIKTKLYFRLSTLYFQYIFRFYLYMFKNSSILYFFLLNKIRKTKNIKLN